MQMETLDTTASDYINELEQRYLQLETRNNELEKNLKEYEYKYLELKEQYDLLVYKRFARSAEQLLADGKQPLLFTEEPEKPEAEEEKQEGLVEAAPFKREKGGREP
jgi:transposase